ncbi:endonuclease domain-containing 1 protein-like isoform X1 [Megalobrama amblycephala]|uniref:endonuclease domain-containing 1 protein-like isoform X1 n=1 Tax=Megalobrama amblycephala TaxID=75352 RepID=UPI002014179A|nr:endonuclease domain-containing 1 protein-like isoform X1 [Megalobrama amblycephala]
MNMHLFIVSVLTVLLAMSFPFAISEVLEAFTKCKEFFYKEQPPVISGILETRSRNNHYKIICQKYHKMYKFATFYNTENRIPVFSAYKYTGQSTPFKRPRIPWMVEPQLDPPVDDMTLPYANQAISEDYNNIRDHVNRGHLFPCGHAADEVTANSTFTLTNIVPQKISFNAGSWNRMENEIKDIMNKYCYDNNEVLAHVLTGAIPGKSKLNERVNVPSYLWTAFCCYNRTGNSWVSQAYWAPNVGEDKNKVKTINKTSLQKLQEFLSQQLMTKVQLFNNNCAKKHTTN